MRHLSRWLMRCCLLFLLAACAERLGPEALEPRTVEIQRGAAEEAVPVHVVTTRQRHAGQRLPVYSNHRSERPAYARFDVHVPDGRPGSSVPVKDFSVSGREDFEAYPRFLADLLPPRGKHDVAIFVHGYNTSLPEAVFRAAQLSADSGTDAAQIVFSWPSAAQLRGYIEDRDAADFSRVALADLLTALAHETRAGRIMVIGHSMGGRLTMESLAQLRMKGRTDVLNRVEVILADPDIDVDLFWTQAGQVGPLNPPLVVLTAADDRALGVSAFLAGKRKRIGGMDIRDPAIGERADRAGIRIIDISAVDPKEASTHSRFVLLAADYQRLPAAGHEPDIRSVGAFVFNTIGAGFSRIGDGLTP